MTRLSYGAGLAVVLAGVAAACDGSRPLSIEDPCGPPPENSAPQDLRCTGLYADFEARRLATGVRPYAPGSVLWSDGTDKHRFIFLPPGATIDASDPDEWTFPVGTKAWKQFALAGRVIETRFFHKTGPDKWVRAAYVWSADGKTAVREDAGIKDFEGTGYAVPSFNDCNKCHEGRKDRLLGFEAFGLAEAQATGYTLPDLLSEGRVRGMDPAAGRAPAGLDGKALAALAWLHVNCGTSCHNGGANSTANNAGLVLRLETRQLAAAATGGLGALDPVRSTFGVGAKTPRWADQPRIKPGDPEGSLLYRLIAGRGAEQMPPLLSRIPDPAGVALVRDWIASAAPIGAAPASPRP
jgi:hypothetical protein